MIKAMIFAAGKGERMGHLTQQIPKPLLKVQGQPLIAYHLKKLAAIGVQECLINVRYLGDKIQHTLGDGRAFGLRIHYSVETEALETAGGVIKALDFFENSPFILMSADVLSDYPLEKLLEKLSRKSSHLAHLVMVDNPAHHQEGDFALRENGFLTLEGEKLNYAGMGIFHPALFKNYMPGYRKLGHVLREAILENKITGEHYHGKWLNVDTPERLALAQKEPLLYTSLSSFCKNSPAQ